MVGRSTNRDTIDLVFSFDTTGSMYPCLTQVRRNIVEAVKYLFDVVPNLRIGVIAHGDYCDGPRAITFLNLTTDKDEIIHFVKHVLPTNGGDADECYEAVLHEARSLAWTAGKNKALVLIGDSSPHREGEYNCGKEVIYDWRNEAQFLVESGIKIYPIQALARGYATGFYRTLAEYSGTPKLDLPQFSDITDILVGVTLQQAGQMDQYENYLSKFDRIPSPHVRHTLAQLTGKKLSKQADKIGSRFQVLDVDKDCSIREFVELNGLEFEKGRGFYEFTKKEEIQDYKEVIAQNRETGAIIAGKRARSVLGIPEHTANIKPIRDGHIGFVQSTSVNRRLKAGTRFLYEIKETTGIA